MGKEEIKEMAFQARTLYQIGVISRKEAKEKIEPYIEIFNLKAVEIAKKYNLKPKKISFAGFVR